MIPQNEQALSELVGTILVIILVIAIAGIIAALVFGWSIPLQRTPYFVSEATPIENASIVKLFHAQGDPVSLNPGSTEGLPVKITLAKGVVTYDVTPLPTAAGKGWRTGETLYIFRNASGVWIADTPARIQNSTGFSPGPWRLSLVDGTSNVLIVQHTLDLAGDGNGLVADFFADPVSGTAPLTVNFTDQSGGGPTSWQWDFGDGSPESPDQNPSHIFTGPGTYTVTLTVTNSGGSDAFSREIVVAPSVAGFTVEAWVKWNKNPAPAANDERWATITVDGTADGNARYHLQHNEQNTRFEFAARNNQQRQFRAGTTNPQQGVWYYVVGVYEADFGNYGRILIYVNGSGEGSQSFTSGTRGLKATTGTIQTGSPAGVTFQTQGHSSPWHNLRKFHSEVRDLITDERAFTPAEILARYNAGHP